MKIGVGFVKEALISEREVGVGGTWRAVKDVGPTSVCAFYEGEKQPEVFGCIFISDVFWACQVHVLYGVS